ncbi:MAG: hypothetical protein KA764_15760, partial [Anaerolineales bacterium]|nr:hypothetical protein [Anaerolineales bacterium]
MSSAFTPRKAEGGWRLTLNRLLPSACGLVLAALAAAPLFSNPGFLSTRGIGDSPNLLFRVHQLLASLAAGEFPARWMPDAAYGYGLPYFTYYASASTHLAAALKAYGFSYVSALKLTQALALLAGAGGLWGWLRAAGFSRGAAALAAAAYTFAPFHLVNLYIRGDSLAELWAQGLFPWALWAAQRLLEQPTFARAGALADVVALLILTHNISALNFLPLVGLYLALGGWRRARTRWPAAALAVLWGLALTAFFWLPALREGEFVQLGDLTRGYFFYGNHFRGGDLFQWTPLFDYAGQPFSLGLVQTALAAAGLVVWLWRAVAHRRWPAVEVFLVAGLALTTLLITPLSSPLWEHVPLLRYTQFPWRFLAPQALFLAALTGYLAAPAGAEAGWRRWGRIGVSGLGGLALAVSALAGLRLEFIPLTDADVTAERLNVYEYFTTALGNTVNAEYLPSAVRPRPFTSAALLGRAPRLTALSGTAEGERVWRRGAAEEWQVRVAGPEPAVMAFPTFYWPGWEAAIDGQPAPVRAAEGLGWLTVEAPAGAHTVTFRLGRTPLRLGAEVFSLLALVVPAAVYLWRRRRAVSLTPSTAAWRPWLLVSGMGVLGFLVLRLIPSAPPSAAPLSMDFDTLAYPHAAPVRFANGAALTQVAYSATHLPSGATLTVTTHWRAPVTATAVFQIAAPLANFAAP